MESKQAASLPSYAWFTSNNPSPSGSLFTHNGAFQALGNGVHCTRYKQDKNKEDKEKKQRQPFSIKQVSFGPFNILHGLIVFEKRKMKTNWISNTRNQRKKLD